MFSTNFKTRDNSKKKIERILSVNPFLKDIFKARGLEHNIVKLKEKERSSKQFLAHCQFLESINTPAKSYPKDSLEVKQAVSTIPILLAAAIQPSSADKYLREFRHFSIWGAENGRITSPPTVSTVLIYLVVLLHRTNSLA